MVQSSSLFGGFIKGIYPDILTMDPVPGDMWAYPTLDVRIVSSVVDGVVQSSTILYDKRREACYHKVPIAQYLHVSSALSARTGPNVLLGQLHRFFRIIMDRTNFVDESARALHGLLRRGFHHSSLFKVLKRFLHARLYWYGDASHSPVLQEIACRVSTL